MSFDEQEHDYSAIEEVQRMIKISTRGIGFHSAVAPLQGNPVAAAEEDCLEKRSCGQGDGLPLFRYRHFSPD